METEKFDRTTHNRNVKRELIKKHLEDWHGLKKASIEYFFQTGKATGNFLLALEEMLDEYAKQHLPV